MAAVWLVLAVGILLWLLYRRLVFTRAFRFPGPRAWPLLGNSLLMLGSQEDFFRLCRRVGLENPGGVFQLWVGMRPFVFLYSSATIQPLVTSSVHLEKNYEYTLSADWLGAGLITSKGEMWQRQRKMLTPCFHFNILKEFSMPVWRHAHVLLDKLMSSGTSRVDILPLAKLLALDIICETAMGIDIGTQMNSVSEYPTAISRMTHILCQRFITPWQKPKVIFDLTSNGREYNKLLAKVHNFVSEIIQKRKAKSANGVVPMHGSDHKAVESESPCEHLTDGLERESLIMESERAEKSLCKDCSLPICQAEVIQTKPRRRLALLDYLLQLSRDDPSITDKHITDQVHTFMFAGHDTISSAISFVLFVLGHHPHWQDAVVEEIDSEFPDLLQSEPEARLFMKGFPVLDRCIKEALRLYPPAPLVGRTINTPLDTPGGTLPVGTTAIIYTFLLHRDPSVFTNPDQFDPDRFLSENTPLDPFAYIPFSAGPRNCIGKSLALLELKIITAMVLKTFRVRSLQAVEELDLSFDIVLTNSGGIHLQFLPRD